MKKVLISSILSLGLLTSLSAYEVNGDLGVKWTGFKTKSKVGVPGSFKKIDLTIEKNDNFVDFLKSAKVTIDTLSLDSKLPFRDKNITSTLFSLATAKMIKGSISSVDEAKKTLVLEVTMNEVTKPVTMTYEVKDNNVVAKGTVEILDFAMDESYAAYVKKCGALHAGTSFSDVDVEFTLPFK